MSFNINKLKSNFLFLVISIVLIVVFLVISLFAGESGSSLEEAPLGDGEVNINGLVINEVMTSNKGTIADENGKLYDYMELYNGTSEDINLKNYGLSDNGRIKWVFPEVIIKSKEYLVVFLSGTNEEGLHAKFKLSSAGGETLALFSPSGKVVDGVDTISLIKDTVMARDESGEWNVQLKPTPGHENTVKGHEEFIASLISEDNEKSIIINEILPNNKGNFRDSYGEFSGFVEVKNVSDKTINLENYALSNSSDINFKWKFPSVSLKKGEVLVVYTSNRNITEGELHASFKLNNENGDVILSNNKGKIIDKVSYVGIGNGYAYINTGNHFEVDNNVSPGYANNAGGIKKFQSNYVKTPEGLVINEVMNNNYSYLAQNGGNYYDWIELYNNGSETINLSDYYMTTNTNSINMYKLPDVKLNKGEYYILMASGDENLSNKSYKHANFNVSDTQSLYLVKDREVVDSLFVANVPLGYSMGKGKKSGVYYYSNPTPKKKNGSGSQSISYKPVSNYESGIYNDVKKLSVKLTGTGKLYYTTDGSEPTTSSKIYSSPLSIKKTTVLKVRAYESGKLKSEVATYSYIVNEKHKLDVMSLSLNKSDLNSLHYNAWTEGYEKKVTAEFFDLDGGGFEIDCGLKLFGGSTRGHAKKSYELKFKKKYGDGELNYQVFEDKDYSVFNSIVLRTGSQDEMGDASKKTLLRDIVGTTLVEEYTSVDVQAYRPIVLYINGEYWGMYFIREKIDETIVGNHYNVKATKSNTDLLRIDGQVKSGSASKYNNMISFVSNNDMSKSANYKKIEKQIDIENFIDFWIAETWVSNNDIVNVRFFSHPDVEDGKWRWIFYDLDFAMYNTSINYYNFSVNPGGMTSLGYSTTLLRNLMKNKTFKKKYAERLSYNLLNTWSEKNVLKRIDEVIDELTVSELKRNFERWGMSYSTWKSSVNYLKSYAKNRNKYMVSQAKSFLGLSSGEMKKYFGDVK